MFRKGVFLVFLLMLTFLPLGRGSTAVVPNKVTHSAFIMTFTSVTCDPCMLNAEPALETLWNENRFHSWHIVSFHVATGDLGDPLETDLGRKLVVKYGLYDVVHAPLVVFDGGYSLVSGAPSNIKNDYELKIWEAQSREVPKVKVRVNMAVQGNTISADFYVDLDQDLALYRLRVIGFVVENGVKVYVPALQSEKSFDHIFRGVIINDSIGTLTGNGYKASRTWKAPSYVKPKNCEIVIAVFDENGYSIQSGCSVCSEANVTSIYRFANFHTKVGIISGDLDEKAYKYLMDSTFFYGQRYYNTYPGIGDLLVIGGPLTNPVAAEFISKTPVSFGLDPWGVSLSVSCSLKVNMSRRWEDQPYWVWRFNRSDWGRSDYAVITKAYDERAHRSILMVMGCTRYGTMAASIFIKRVLDESIDYSLAVILWIDYNMDGRVDIEELNIMAYLPDG